MKKMVIFELHEIIKELCLLIFRDILSNILFVYLIEVHDKKEL